MHSNMNFPAPLSVLGFVAGFGGLAMSLLVVLVATAIHKAKFAGLVLRLVGLSTLAYLLLLLGFSVVSRQAVLARGEEKYFCEIDCHLAYSVVETKAIPVGDVTSLQVTVKTRFDETTISPQRPREAPLTPNPRVVYLLDSKNRHYEVNGSSGTPLTSSLKPGDFYVTTLSFLVPKSESNLRLLITAPGWEEHFLIGDENSWLHRKTYLAL